MQEGEAAAMQGWISKVLRALLVSVVLLVVPGLTAQASARSTVDLLADANIRLDGAVTENQVGYSVAGAGDVNDDGRDDVIVGAHLADNNDRSNSGSAYVIYGRAASPAAPIDLADTNGGAEGGEGVAAADGFQIDGAGASHQAGESVAGAGDVNGDGHDDVIVGALGATSNDFSITGSAYVIYGRAASPAAPIDLADTNGDAEAGEGVAAADGFQIAGGADGDRAGISVAGAGDVNDDGRDDVIVGADVADNNGRLNSGSAYVIYGRVASPAAPINLGDTNGGAAVGTGVDPADGFQIDGAADGDGAGRSVAGAGDVNDDGHDDVIVGAVFARNNGRPTSGSAYVLYGGVASPTAPINLDDTNGGAAAGGGVDPADGFRIDGAAAQDGTGVSVAGAGDINDDGRDDVIVGASGADSNGRLNSGSAYVIYGRVASPAAPINLADTNGGAAVGSGVDPADGFRIDGAAAADRAGRSVAGAGDVDDDGRDDVIVGAHLADNSGRSDSGSAYVIYGRVASPAAPINLADTNGDAAVGSGVDPADGFLIGGAAAGDNAGYSVGGAGDVNGDGADDVIVGAYLADNKSRSSSGSAYVVNGQVADADGDGVGDGVDNCPNDANAGQADLDSDDVGDACDPDIDGDGTANADDAFPTNPAESVDTDGDDIGNEADTDDDGDDVPDSEDAFPLDDEESVDTDKDGQGNKADTDDDGDGVPDSSDAFPLNDKESVDTDKDGQGNNADTDDDGDGIPDSEDAFPNDASKSNVEASATPAPEGCAPKTSPGVSCEALPGGGRLITGGAGSDVLVGTAANDIIRCGEGNDLVLAGAGNDTINCAGGRDVVSGGAGDDRISGGTGNDRISGRKGRDRIDGNEGNDILHGNEDNDSILGSRGRDRISGGLGKDRLSGNAGNDRINGGAANDRISGGAGRDRLAGVGGNDYIGARDRERDFIGCGAGRDGLRMDLIDKPSRCERIRRG